MLLDRVSGLLSVPPGCACIKVQGFELPGDLRQRFVAGVSPALLPAERLALLCRTPDALTAPWVTFSSGLARVESSVMSNFRRQKTFGYGLDFGMCSAKTPDL